MTTVTPKPPRSREEIETQIGLVIRWILIVFFCDCDDFFRSIGWLIYRSVPEQDILTNPTKLVPTAEDIQTTLHPVGCWLRYGTDELDENPDVSEDCVNVFGQSSFTIVLAEQGFPPFILNSLLLALLTVTLTLFSCNSRCICHHTIAVSRTQYHVRWYLTDIYVPCDCAGDSVVCRVYTHRSPRDTGRAGDCLHVRDATRRALHAQKLLPHDST